MNEFENDLKDANANENASNKINEEDFVQKNKLKILKETFLDWTERSNVDGYAKIFEYEHNFIRFIWTCICLTGISLTAYIVGQNIMTYLEYGVVTQIGIVYEKPTIFPAVTFFF